MSCAGDPLSAAEQMRLAALTSITVVTPWYEHEELLPDWAHAVSGGRRVVDRAIVINNGGFKTPLPQPDWLTVISPDTNLGFSRASNIGLRAAKTDAVLFLNNDVVMSSTDWLDTIRAVLEPGVLVGKIRYDQHGDVDGYAYPYLDGWCLAGMRDDLLALDGFDETFDEPAYYSDNDLCLRGRASGLLLREARVGLVH
jgi:GT2 family glycosyltransferase